MSPTVICVGTAVAGFERPKDPFGGGAARPGLGVVAGDRAELLGGEVALGERVEVLLDRGARRLATGGTALLAWSSRLQVPEAVLVRSAGHFSIHHFESTSVGTD